MKPKTDVVMADIIQQIKENIPFSLSEEEMCAETCAHGCPKKLLEYLHTEISEWEQRLKEGETPNFRDVQKLAASGKKIYRVLEKNHLVDGSAG